MYNNKVKNGETIFQACLLGQKKVLDTNKNVYLFYFILELIYG